MSNKLTSNPKNKIVIGSIIVQKRRILAGLVPELEARNQLQWQRIGYNQVIYVKEVDKQSQARSWWDLSLCHKARSYVVWYMNESPESTSNDRK